MEKQTAVEWLEQIIKSMVINGGDLGEDYPALLVHIAQAKEMEKEQIIDAVNFGDERGKITTYSTAEQYYNETFKNK